ncbi:MAG: hypothetical protein V3T05_03145 [Myxococcota bacterium]
MTERAKKKGRVRRSKPPAKNPGPDQVYEPPAITWQEEWVPVAFAVSCARLPGLNAACTAVPST